jgi:hypothetical protein
MKITFALRLNPGASYPTLLARVVWGGEKALIALPVFIPSEVNWKQSPRVIAYAHTVQQELQEVDKRLGINSRPRLVKALFLSTQENPKVLELLDAFVEAGMGEGSAVVRNHLRDFLEVRGATEIPIACFYRECMKDFENFIDQFGMPDETRQLVGGLQVFIQEVRRLRCECKARENSGKAL